MRLWFARHGEVEASMVGAFVGRTDTPLSPLGRHQAEAIAAYLEEAPLDAIVCSPRRRSLDTAAPLAKAKGMKLDVRKDFAEMDFGDWEGLMWPAIVAQDADYARRWEQPHEMDLPCPGGESCQVFQDRVHGALDGLRAEFADRNVLLMGHAGTGRAILGNVLGRPYKEMLAFAQDYGCLNAAAWTDVGAQVALVNFVPGPRSEGSGD